MKKNKIKVLGSYGGKDQNMELSSFKLSNSIIIDAGNILDGVKYKIHMVEHLFITHSHLDHIKDIAFLIDLTFEQRTKPLKIYGRKGTLDNIHKYILNWEIWPDFTKIELMKTPQMTVELIEIKLDETIEIDNWKLTAVKNNHVDSSNGYMITKDDSSVLLTSDTYCCDEIWDLVNTNKQISAVIIDVSFPSRLSKLAFDSKHLTPDLLDDELKKLKRDDVTIHINHLKPATQAETRDEINERNLLLNNGKILEKDDIIEF